MSRDFWMPDQSCRVCYDCDTQFTVFNRRHHCRLCGRVFCAKCTTNSVPALSDEPKSVREDGDRIRVCNYCFKQWKQGSAVADNTMTVSSPGLSSSPSSSSLVSNQSSCYTCNSGSSAGSAAYATGPFQHISCTAGQSSCLPAKMNPESTTEDQVKSHEKVEYLDTGDTFSDQCGSYSRSDEEDDDHPFYGSHSGATPLSPDTCSGAFNYSKTGHIYEHHLLHPSEENTCSTRDLTQSPENCKIHQLNYGRKLEDEAEVLNTDIPSGFPPSNVSDDANVEAVDYENNGLLWLPPEPEDEEDEREALLSEDDDTGDYATEKWGYLRSSSFGMGESQSRDMSFDEHRHAMKNVVDGHFRDLVSQLLQAENLPSGADNMDDNWLDVITMLSWEAANFLKPDTSMGGGMDPGGYVKIKCIACGRRNQSTVVKGVVCKKNVAHRRMTSKINKARLLVLGGALEYQRVANHLSSFDTLLQQEMDYLKMAVAKIDAHHPNVLLVERSVSRYAQDYLLAKDISLVLNVKRQLLERIARCTGAQIAPSIDNLSSTKLGFCDSFHVEKFLEDLGSAGQAGKKLTKTLMFFEGCPRPLGCTILLKGASGDELKKVKHVVQYGVFAAYHLALETSFLADEGACLPELPLTSPIKVALPDRPSGVDRSISMIPGYNVQSSENPEESKDSSNPFHSGNDLFLDIRESSRIVPMYEARSSQSESSSAHTPNMDSSKENIDITDYGADVLGPRLEKASSVHDSEDISGRFSGECCVAKRLDYLDEVVRNDKLGSNHFCKFEVSGQGISFSHDDANKVPLSVGQLNSDGYGELGPFKEEFPPTPSDQQSILVSLSTRCVWKGSVCERPHLFRIKYYGNFDKPLGRFLRDQLFDQEYRCHSCEMPSEAHIHCYTHQQGSLTISVKKVSGFLLAGEREGKIWMWHRCLRCPRINGFPPATKRVLMSDAAWGLSFGKFLELSFSNHAAASRLATCGHSIHRDCLRFYGFGKMVACFRYAPISVHSVYLPPPEVEFSCSEQEWILEDYDEVRSKASRLFTEVSEVIHQISKKIANETSAEAPESDKQIATLESILQMEKKEFEESMWCILNKKVKCGKHAVDILEMNRLRRKLVFLAYVWDQRLIHNARSRVPKSNSMKDMRISSQEKRAEMNSVSRSGRGFSSFDCSLENLNTDIDLTEAGQSQNNSTSEIHEGINTCGALGTKQDHEHSHSSGINSNNHSDSLKFVNTVRRAWSEGHFPVMENLSGNLDSAWAGNQGPLDTASKEKSIITAPHALNRELFAAVSKTEPVAGNCTEDTFVGKPIHHICSDLPAFDPSDVENPSNWVRIPFSFLYGSFIKISSENVQKLGMINNYCPVYVPSLRELVHLGGGRLLLPVASSDIVLPVYDDEPTSIIAYTLTSPDYQEFMSEVPEKQKDLGSSTSFSILESFNSLAFSSFEDVPSESLSIGSADESILSSGSRSVSGFDQLQFPYSLHATVSFSDDGPPGKVKYTVTCYFAKQFEALRRICCPSELNFIVSLSRCKKWGAQGGKSNVFFAKTLDERFIIKQVTKTELESFIKFAPSYFKYLSESLSTGCPTSLAKILGIYQVTSKHMKGGKESRMDVLVMENLLFRRNITRLYDLKGSSRSRYNPDASGSNKVLLDQNLIEAMPTSPIFLGTKAKRLLERAVWNDTAFLASINVMDYSLLVGVDEEKQELVLGIIDFMRQYTWDKHLETWVKASGILGGPKNASPTVISPKQYKKRFRKAMSAYFLMVPDQWSSSLSEFSK